MNDTAAYWLTRAYLLARDESDDPHTQNAAILINRHNLVIGAGANTFPAGVILDSTRTAGPIKYSYMEHAERNAIYEAAKAGRRIEGGTLYVAWAACTDCARAIIQSGITSLVRHQPAWAPEASETWAESISIADRMMSEAGIEILTYTDPLPDAPDVMRHGRVWSPSQAV
jgi:dCMP deaminase